MYITNNKFTYFFLISRSETGTHLRPAPNTIRDDVSNTVTLKPKMKKQVKSVMLKKKKKVA